MQHSRAFPTSFVIVALLHVGIIAAVVLAPAERRTIEVTPPTLQGVIVMMEQPQAVVPPPPEPPPPPPPEPPPPPPKPKPAPKPVPKAPPSERAVKAPEPEPAPPPVPTPAPPQTPAPAPQPAAAPIVAPTADAATLNNPHPVYPHLSRRLREEGVVILQLTVKANGSVGDIRVKTSSGFKRLDDVAVKTVKRWRFIPASQDGKALDFDYELPIEFNLD